VLAVTVGASAGGATFAVQTRQSASRSMTATPDSTPSLAVAQVTPDSSSPLDTPVDTPVEPQPTATPSPESQPTDVVATVAPTPPPVQSVATVAPTETSMLAEQVEAAMAQVVPNGSAVYIGPGGRVVARYQASTPRVAASTIKLALVLEAFRQEAAGTLDLSTTYTVRQADVVGGTGILQGQVGRTLSLRDLAGLAILYSDNVAANVLLDHVGMEAVNANMRNLGFSGTYFERKMLDTVAEQRGKENWTTADDLAGLLQGISDRTLLSPAISDQVMALLTQRGKRDLDWIGRGLPAGTLFSHLNGTLDHVRNDAGIVGVPTGENYILAVCQDQLADPTAGEHAIAELARQVNGLVNP
jgi:beta-lactamase class A